MRRPKCIIDEPICAASLAEGNVLAQTRVDELEGRGLYIETVSIIPLSNGGGYVYIITYYELIDDAPRVHLHTTPEQLRRLADSLEGYTNPRNIQKCQFRSRLGNVVVSMSLDTSGVLE